ncbi:kinesin-like protein KIN-12F [Silene latifolia]|uniref:kinesin-like protein KIN-12F n=1 Tax=Silene latifolia TaxID=37657 RepID=UPI003D785FB0
MNTVSISSVRKLLSKSKSLSTKPSSMASKSQSFAVTGDENSPPIDPNIQVNESQFPIKNSPIKSPSKLSISQNAIDFTKSNPRIDSSVKVVVRIRPKTVNEKLGDPSIKKVSGDCLKVGDREFKFDSVLDSNSKQEDVFDLVGLPLVKDALAGYNASVLSYGQTGSGKTYTMWGPPGAMVEGQSPSTQQGIVPRMFQMLFREIEKEKADAGDKQINYQCRCSFLEIYHGQIGDLLDPTQRNLQIKDDAKNGFYIENLTEEYVTCYDDVTQILIKGLSSRKVGATSINSRSSRSHIIFTCVIESWCKETPANNFSSSKTSRISLVDLAGLGRNKQADAGREFERERKELNSSLSHLGHLVNILAAGTQPDDRMYTDSSLTHLLQQSLGGNAKLAVICNISPDIKNYVETLSTLRFGQRISSIQNKPVINEITEEDMDDLTDQIRQLKDELIRAKLNVKSAGPADRQFTGKNIRESVNQLRISLNRSLVLPITNDIEEDIHADETDVTELCKHLDDLHASCDSDSMNFASVRGSSDSFFTSEHEINCLHDSVEIDSPEAPDSSSRNSISKAFQEPPLSESPKIRNFQRKSVIIEDTKSLSAVSLRSVSENEPVRSSLRSSRLFSGPPESLAASLKRGLDVIDSHQQNSSSIRDSVAFSFEHLMLKPSPAADKINASVQTLSPSSFICASCRQKGEGEGEDAAESKDKVKELEKVCSEQSAKIEELNQMVEQLKTEKERVFTSQKSQAIEDKGCEPEIIKETCAIEENHKSENESFDVREKEELLAEIQFLKNKLQVYTDSSAPNKSIDKLRSSLLSRSMQIRKSMSSQFNNAEEMEKERERWTEMESEWINLTDELRIDIESHREHAEKVETELKQEKKYTEELDDALNRAVLGHARFVEHYVELQEKYNHLSENHKRVMETINDVKRAASKAGAKGSGARYAKAFAAELTTIRAEEKKEREHLRKVNRSLRLQLRETAEAVHTAGELLVRLKEAEETASFAESNMTELQQENEKLRKQLEKVKNKHKMEMTTMKQYMAESKLPESALRRPVHFDEEPLPTSTYITPHDDEAWKSEFGDIYQHGHY